MPRNILNWKLRQRRCDFTRARHGNQDVSQAGMFLPLRWPACRIYADSSRAARIGDFVIGDGDDSSATWRGRKISAQTANRSNYRALFLTAGRPFFFFFPARSTAGLLTPRIPPAGREKRADRFVRSCNFKQSGSSLLNAPQCKYQFPALLAQGTRSSSVLTWPSSCVYRVYSSKHLNKLLCVIYNDITGIWKYWEKERSPADPLFLTLKTWHF